MGLSYNDYAGLSGVLNLDNGDVGENPAFPAYFVDGPQISVDSRK